MKESTIKCILLLAKEKIIKDLSSDIKKIQMTMKERKQMKKQKNSNNDKKIVGVDASVYPLPDSNTQTGITLIALIITIIVLLILAMVSIKLVWDGGIIAHAQNAVNSYNDAQTNELQQLNILEEQMKPYGGSNNSQLQDGWWEFKDDKEKTEIQFSDSEGLVARNGDVGGSGRYDKKVTVLIDPEIKRVHFILVEVDVNQNYMAYVLPGSELAVESLEGMMQTANDVSFAIEKGKWITMRAGLCYFSSGDEIYTGPSPIQLSDFTTDQILCKSYLERIIASFNN